MDDFFPDFDENSDYMFQEEPEIVNNNDEPDYQRLSEEEITEEREVLRLSREEKGDNKGIDIIKNEVSEELFKKASVPAYSKKSETKTTPKFNPPKPQETAVEIPAKESLNSKETKRENTEENKNKTIRNVIDKDREEEKRAQMERERKRRESQEREKNKNIIDDGIDYQEKYDAIMRARNQNKENSDEKNEEIRKKIQERQEMKRKIKEMEEAEERELGSRPNNNSQNIPPKPPEHAINVEKEIPIRNTILNREQGVKTAPESSYGTSNNTNARRDTYNYNFNSDEYYKNLDAEQKYNQMGGQTINNQGYNTEARMDNSDIVEEKSHYYEQEYQTSENNEPYNVYDYEVKKEIPASVKKIIMFVVMFLVIVGVPLIFALVGRISSDKKKENKKENNVSLVTENTLSNEALYEEAKKQSNTTNNGASRFSNLDELSFYIESTTASTLSNEMMTVNLYSQGALTYNDFINTMNGYIKTTNDLIHLLVVNKASYEEEGLSETYETLRSNIEILMSYGDMAVYNAQNGNNVK